MYYKMKIFVAVFLLLSIASIKSDHTEDDCREIHCPQPDLDCPADSELKSSSTDDTEEDDDEDEENETNPFQILASKGLIEEFFPSLWLATSTSSPPHVVQKRSLQHRRREAIKIVPGDYRSFEPEFFKYHNHHQPNRRWKRDLDKDEQKQHSEKILKKCCPEFQCVCGSCPGVPKCEKGKLATMTEEGHGLPGSCCSKYECVPEVECSLTSQPNVSYWPDECTKCDCFAGHKLCQKLCEDTEDDESANNCFSVYLNKPIINGDSWLEDDDCKECKCIDGESHCMESFCKPLECESPVKIKGRCCRVCPATSSTITTTTVSPDVSSTTTEPANVTSSSNSSSKFEHSTTTTVEASTSESPEGTSTKVTTLSSTTTSTTTSTTSGVPELITDPEEQPDSTTSTPHADIISTPNEFRVDRNDFIIIVAVAALLTFLCALIMHMLFVHNKKKKDSMYSTIPSSESSQTSSVTLA